MMQRRKSLCQAKASSRVHHKILDSRLRGNDERGETVIPGKAAGRDPESRQQNLDSRLRGNDGSGDASRFCLSA